MKTSNELPADTRGMSTVHDALRRDLSRATAALSSTSPPSDAQRVAIAAHVRWMMDFLHGHHAGEDQGLWPLVRARNSAAGDVLNQMDADHAAIGPLIDHVRIAAETYTTDASPAARQGLATAIGMLRSVLDPHLRREEDEMMPIVSASITHSQWEAFTHDTYVKPKTKKELGKEGHWLIDSLDPRAVRPDRARRAGDTALHPDPRHGQELPAGMRKPLGSTGRRPAFEPTTSRERRRPRSV